MGLEHTIPITPTDFIQNPNYVRWSHGIKKLKNGASKAKTMWYHHKQNKASQQVRQHHCRGWMGNVPVYKLLVWKPKTAGAWKPETNRKCWKGERQTEKQARFVRRETNRDRSFIRTALTRRPLTSGVSLSTDTTWSVEHFQHVLLSLAGAVCLLLGIRL